MKGFVTRDEGDFVMRMPKRDSEIYGDRALVLLREAKSVLGARYGLKMDKPVLVEFFPSQADFAIRTFGNLGGQGILGACFGTVVTMNSPGSLSARRSNWESTLWHEFCHVVTLSVTNNRMPRWLSEGISVYEEQQRDASWGMRMSAEPRAKVVDDEMLTPMGKLTSAFLNAKDGDALMFAYYESAQAVDYLIKTYGMEKFRAILGDLAKGVRINEAIGKNTLDMEKLEPAFVKHIRDAAQKLAPKADWSEPDEDLNRNDPGALTAWLKKHPDNIAALKQQTQILLGDKKLSEAAEMAKRLVTLFPDDVESGCGYELAAAAHRGAKQDKEEAAMLREWTRRSGDASSAFNRLMELDLAAKNWTELENVATRSLAINPFQKLPNEALASAAEASGKQDVAIGALKKLMILGPDNPVETNFKLARLLKDKDRPAAKRYVLDALAEAPRFREGQRLLLQMQDPQP
jgi:tetratricopeptide (TPR) repeat protein